MLATQLAARGIDLVGRKALDFGCGVGRVTGPLADRFEEVVGVDISPAMLDLARRYNVRGHRCRFMLNGTADLSQFSDGAFDFVYSKLVLQHMQPRAVRAYVPELLRVLRPAGILAFQLPEPVACPVIGGPLKRSIPMPIVRAYRRLKKLVTRGIDFPKMEVHGMMRNEVVDLIERSGGVVIDVMPDHSHGEESAGFLYIARPAS
jgi:SAM-dependent methyltransferase